MTPARAPVERWQAISPDTKESHIDTDRKLSPAECFLNASGFCRWEDTPQLFTFSAHEGWMWVAVCDLENSAADDFTLTIEKHRDALLALVYPGPRAEATVQGLMTAIGQVMASRRDW